MTATILVVDDDAGLRLVVRRILEREGHRVRTAGTGAEAVASALEIRPDVVVLDLGLPDRDGFDVMTSLRTFHDIPVLLLTGRDSPMDRVFGLDQGADDYLVKPASLSEIAARVRALLRRAPAATRKRLRDDHLDLDIDLAARSVSLAGESVVLTRLEYDLLVFLLSRPGKVVSRDELLEKVWHSSPEYQSGAVITEYVTRLRRKLGELPFTSVRGIGYRYDPVPTT